MAKARATCTCATCGKEFEVISIRANRRDADSWQEWAEENITECDACKKTRLDAEHAAEAAEAQAAAVAEGLSELIGSDKQVAWAVTIRKKYLDQIDKLIETYKHRDRRKERSEEDDTQLQYAMNVRRFFAMEQRKASWWIDHRTASLDYLVILVKDQIKAPETKEEAKLREAAQAESVAAPEDQTHNGIVDITVTEKEVSAEYVKNDDFRELVKKLGYKWNSSATRWELKFGPTTGPIAERAAELGNNLLNAGFAIRIADPDTLQAAVSGDYKPRTERWVTYVPKEGKLFVAWGKDDDIYNAAKKLPGAKYARPGFMVALKHWAEVEDFARIYDFRFSAGALREIDAARAAVSIVTPAPAKAPEYREEDISNVLNGDDAVIEDLKED